MLVQIYNLIVSIGLLINDAYYLVVIYLLLFHLLSIITPHLLVTVQVFQSSLEYDESLIW